MEKKQTDYRRKAIGMLMSYKENKVQINMLKIDLQMVESLTIQSNSAVSYDQPRSGLTYRISSQTENEVVLLEKRRGVIEGRIAQLQNQVDKVDVALNNMEESYRTVLKIKYIENKRWRDVCNYLNYSEEYIRKELKEGALDMLTGFLFPDVHCVGLFDIA